MRKYLPLLNRRVFLLTIAILCNGGCAHFSAQPLNASRSAARLTGRRLAAGTWTLKTLTEEALRNHPDVALARAQY